MLSLNELSLLRRSPAAFALLSTIVTTGCTPLAALNALVPDDGYSVRTDIAYGSLPRQKLDIYRLEALEAPAPVVVWLYGGNWRTGERGGYRFVGEALTRHGYVVVVPDYRLYPQARFPAFVEDAAAAVRWAYDNVAAHGGDPRRIFLMGHSAGAHIAALLALDKRYLAAAGVPFEAVRGTVGLAGPYAFDPARYEKTRPVFAGTAAAAMQPTAFVDGTEGPMLLLHGAEDETVYLDNSDKLATRIRAAGGTVRQITYPDLGHIGILIALATPFRHTAPVLGDIVAFLRAW